ncbi:hypothetical protein [Rhodopirellula baltica]
MILAFARHNPPGKQRAVESPTPGLGIASVADSGSESVCRITKSLAYAAGYDMEQLGPLGLQTESL